MTSPIDVETEPADLHIDAARRMRTIRADLLPYRTRSWRGWWQLSSDLAFYTAGWVGAAASWGRSIPLLVASTLVVAVFVVRLFIIFHDCGHGSFSASRRTNEVVGTALSVLVFTPFRYWNHAHAIHHASSSNLDRRHIGDIWTMTVDEYQAATRARRFYYRLYHHPAVLLTVGGLIKFVIVERIVTRPDTTPTRVKRSVHLTNALLVGRVLLLAWFLGPTRYLAIELLTVLFGGALAIWLFYVQHKFEDSYWAEQSDWNFVDAALSGSSYLKLGRVMQFASGNIGFHHLHHLDARIPNYNLARCDRDHPDLRPTVVLTLRESFSASRMKLWDTTEHRWVGYPARTR